MASNNRPFGQEVNIARDALERCDVVMIIEGDRDGPFKESKPRYDQDGLRIHEVYVRDEDMCGETGHFIQTQWESFRQLLIGMNLNY